MHIYSGREYPWIAEMILQFSRSGDVRRTRAAIRKGKGNLDKIERMDVIIKTPVDEYADLHVSLNKMDIADPDTPAMVSRYSVIMIFLIQHVIHLAL